MNLNLLPIAVGSVMLAVLLEPRLRRWPSIPLASVLLVLGFIVSEIVVATGGDTGLRSGLLHDLFLYGLLPILVFEAALNIDQQELRREGWVVGALALPLLLAGILLTALALSIETWALPHVPWMAALMIGVILSATDPVSVVATFRQVKAPPRLTAIMEGESLFNDAAAIALFAFVLALIQMPEEIGILDGVFNFLRIVAGGLLLGVLAGFLARHCLSFLGDDAMITLFTLGLVFGAFWLAEHLLQVSGVMAVLLMGLMLSRDYREHPAAETRFATHTWEMLAFAANALVFALLGVSIQPALFLNEWPLMLLGISVLLLVRFLLVALGAAPVARFSGAGRLTPAQQGVLIWGGVRGAVAVILVFALPPGWPWLGEAQAIVYGIVVFSLLVQAPTLAWLLRSTGQAESVSR